MIPSDLGVPSYHRFDRYGRFVKHLVVHPACGRNYGCSYFVKGWAGLLEQARNKTLLPSLPQLILTAHSLTTHEQCLWVRMFMSPSLNDIQMQGIQDYIDPLAATILLQQLVLTCPGLHRLSIFPGYDSGVSTPKEDNNAYDYAVFGTWVRPASFYLGLPTLQALRDLTCAADIFASDAVHVLGRLPLLERLDVYLGVESYENLSRTCARTTTCSTPPRFAFS